MKIRGTNQRKKVAKAYSFIWGYVEPVSCSDGEKGDTGAFVFDRMYYFILENKLTKKRVTLKCGRDSGRDLLNIYNLSSRDLFDPYRGISNGGPGGESGKNDCCVDLTAMQLFCATNWMLKYLPAHPDGPLEHINVRVRSQMVKRPSIDDILKVNDILFKYNILSLKEYILRREQDVQLKREVVNFLKLDTIVRRLGKNSCFK